MHVRVLDGRRWRALEAAHVSAAERLTAAHRARAAAGDPHPVEDFLFSYYSLRPSQLRRWYPGVGTVLLDAEDRSRWPFHHVVRTGSGQPAVTVDVASLSAERGAAIADIARILRGTTGRAANFGCFGLHEWAMVYRQPEQRRHAGWPLRLSPADTDRVVQTHTIRCSHYDAFRFFTPDARGRNALQPTKASRAELEQPGCLHAAMDLYKWAYKLIPAAPGELLLQCFAFARHIREVDMRASPYDLSALGYSPIRIETPAGKAEYVAAQRDIARRATGLRARVLAVADAVLAGER